MTRTFPLILALTVAAVLAKGTSADGDRLTVHMLDYAGLTTATRAELETTATRIFASAGIAIDFLECYSSGARTGNEGCAGPLRPAHVVLRVLRPTREVKGEELGYAAMTPEGGRYISVFINPEQQRARIGSLSNGVLLGHVVAHEIGHLLLGPNSHSPVGIMRARWRPVDEQWMVKGAMLFEASQARRMQARLSWLGRATAGR